VWNQERQTLLCELPYPHQFKAGYRMRALSEAGEEIQIQPPATAGLQVQTKVSSLETFLMLGVTKVAVL